MIKNKRLVIASPSPVDRMRLARVLENMPGITVIAQVRNLSETYNSAEMLRPDLAVLTEAFTLVPEFDCMKALFREMKTRWMTLGNSAYGAPGGAVSRSDRPMISSRMPVFEISAQIDAVFSGDNSPGDVRTVAALTASRDAVNKILLIGASTGGVEALLTVLQDFPTNCPPTAVVQHTGAEFSTSLIRLLDQHCRAKVVVAEDGIKLCDGMIVVAAGTKGHFRLNGRQNLRCTLSGTEPISGHVPSVDALFESACSMGPNVVAALLTGMGRDGAAGLLELRHANCITIGQDEKTSVVYGMPQSAQDIGAVQFQLPLDKIGPALLRSCGLVPDALRGPR